MAAPRAHDVMRVRRLFAELSRRRVTRVAAAYLVVGWAVIEVADTVLPQIANLPSWSLTAVIVLVVLGFPLSLVLSWAYNVTSAGGRRARGLPAQWERMQEILGNAFELPAEQRHTFVRQACAGDADLLREVESLLAAHERPGPLDGAAPPLLRMSHHYETAPSLSRRAPNYQVQERIGGGGMGVVYRARDHRLERDVALKFLPAHLTSAAQAKERFLVEAQAAAALDHPNICTIYDVGESDDGQLFLAMPYYDGETLKRRLERGPLALDEALDIAVQIAGGLSRAHERGIVHRDIKPANVMLCAEGVVKIVDFGVAKLASVDVTRPGLALGTLAYMSPEQAQGDDVDGRTDVWSLGVVLYEMITGERPFRGDHDRIVLNAITTAEPAPPASLRNGVSDELEALVLRALAKRRADRFATAREMWSALNAVRGVRATPGTGAAPQRTLHGTMTSATAGASAGDLTSGGLMAEGERRQATIVVSMIADYDELIERLVPDEMNLLMSRIRTVADDVAREHGGLLNQFDGERFVLLFGVPVAREDDAVRATRAALHLHARLRAVAPDGMPVPQTGIDAGTVVSQALDDGDRAFRVTGSPPQTASRLAEHAAAGEVWLSADCRNAVAPYFETEPRPAVHLRGGRPALVPHRVLAETGLHTRLDAAARSGLTAFTGREVELSTLRRCLEESLAGEGQLVAITGDAGLGKSRLLHEFRHIVDGGRTAVLAGRCQPYGGGVAYLPFIEILRGRLGIDERTAEVEETVARIRAIGDCLEEFIPLYLHLLSIRSTAHPVPKHLQGDAFRLAMQEALAAIITVGAQRQPAVIVLEDWHWADDASQAVLHQVGEMVAGCPLLVVVTARPGYGVEAGSGPQVVPLALKPLERAATGEMLQSVLRVEHAADDLVALIHERTAGNPFYIEEICQALVEQDAILVRSGHAGLAAQRDLELPDSIQGVIRARLDRLDRDARAVVRLAAVIGREFGRTVLERALPDAAGLPRVMDTLKAAGIVQQTRVAPDAAYRFKHVLTQEVAYASLLEHQRRELHARVGAIIEELHGEDAAVDQLERLAHHFSRAELWPQAVQYGLRSAERTSRLAQYHEALQLLERTQRWVARLPGGADRELALTDILLRQERLCETLGQRSRQQQIIDQLIGMLSSSGDRSRLAEVYLRQGDLFTLLRRFAAAENALQSSLALRRELGDRVGERNTLRSIGLLRWHEERNAEALATAEETLRIDRERGDLPAIVGDLTNCGAILRALGEHDRALAMLQEAIATGAAGPALDGGADGDELAVKRVYALQHLANIYRERDDRTRALECLMQAGVIAEQKRLPIQLAYHYTSLAHVHLQEGRVDESLRYYRDSIDLSRRARHASGLANSLRIYGEVLIGLERRDEALPHLTEAAAIFAELRDVQGEAGSWQGVAAAEESLGRPGNALVAWGRAAQLLRQQGDAAGEMVAVEGLARTTRRHVGEASLALSHYQRGVQLAATIGAAALEGRMRNAMGIIEWERGEHQQALAHYERALELFDGLGDDASAALMLNSIGATLKVLGRTEEAERRLMSALELHRRTGDRRLEGHALALLGDIRVDRDDAERAAACYSRSLEIRRAIGDRRGEGWMLHGLARCELVRGIPFNVREHATAAARIATECDDAELATACEQLRRVAD